jgi:dephospho-CoA kinase
MANQPAVSPKLKQRFTVGLTGGIGSGKTMVSDLFAMRGAAVIDTDLIAHRLTAVGGSAIEPIRQHFGDEFINESGALDRPKMRERIFKHPQSKKILESILHAMIRHAATADILTASGSYVLIVVPLLIESGHWKAEVQRVLVVDCPEQVQVERVMKRSGLSADQVRAIMAAQASRATRLAAADDVILNDGSTTDLENQVDRLHQSYCTLAGNNLL